MIQERSIRERIADVVIGKAPLSSFERWLRIESQAMFSEAPAEAVRLVAAVNLLISELHDDVIDDEVFRHDMLALLSTIVVSAPVQAASWGLGRFSASPSLLLAVRQPLAA